MRRVDTVAWLNFAPGAPGLMLGGGFGGAAATVIAGQAFDITLSPELVGGLTAADISLLSIVPTVHEIYMGHTIAPHDQGFVIDFGAVLVRPVTIEIRRVFGGE